MKGAHMSLSLVTDHGQAVDGGEVKLQKLNDMRALFAMS